MGFEPTEAINLTAFPMLRLQPLGHLSVPDQIPKYKAEFDFVKQNLKKPAIFYFDCLLS